MKVPPVSAAVVMLAAMAACNADLVQLQPPIQINAVTIDTTSGRTSLVVTPDVPAELELSYTTAGEPTYTVRAAAGADSVVIPLAQLRPGRSYEYEVHAVNVERVPGSARYGTFIAPRTPPELEALHLTASGSLSPAAVMLEINTPAYYGFVAVNEHGEPVWQYRTAGNPQGFTVRANGDFVFLDAVNGLFEVTPQGRVVHQLSAHFDKNHLPHHDVIATPANTVLFIAQDPRMVGDRYIVGEAIYEWTPETGAVVQRWSAFDFYDPDADIGPRSTTTDWLHANSLAIGDHGNVILSLNWLSQVISIAPSWSTIEWRVGGPHATVKLDSAATFDGQHTASLLHNGHLLVFDNGRDRTGSARNSSAKEIEFTPTGSGRLAWSWTPSATQYDPYVGAARRLPNGNTLVFFGMRDGFAGAVGDMAAYEIGVNGQVTWRLTYDGGNINYRATPLETIAGEHLLNGSRYAVPSALAPASQR